MTKTRNLPASIHARLYNLARSQGRSFQEMLQYYVIERFLYRLFKTDYGHLFVLKGGLIFYALGFSLRRATRDIDFRGFTNNTADNLIQIIKSVCSIQAPDDGIIYRLGSIRTEEINVDADYRGIRISFEALLGSSIVLLQIDVGFNDLITPEPIELQYPVLLSGMEAPVLKIYPAESIISEKFQAMVRLVDINSRWKDFYDIWMLSELKNFDGKLIQAAILATFKQRETPLPSTIPVALTDDFAVQRREQWQIFLDRNKLRRAGIEDFSEVVGRLRLFLLPPFQALINDAIFERQWKARTKWE